MHIVDVKSPIVCIYFIHWKEVYLQNLNMWRNSLNF